MSVSEDEEEWMTHSQQQGPSRKESSSTTMNLSKSEHEGDEPDFCEADDEEEAYFAEEEESDKETSEDESDEGDDGANGGSGRRKASYFSFQSPCSQNRDAGNLVCGNDIRSVGNLGEGIFAKAFQGTIMGRNKKSLTLVIKIFNVPLALEKGSNLQLTNLMELKHRNVVPIFGVILDNSNDLLRAPTGCPRVLLRFFPQGNLLKYLSKPSNPQDYAMFGKLALDIIQGCEYLHDQRVIHGNLAARNVLIQKSVSKHKIHYNAIVSDYGIAQLAVNTPGFSFKPLKGYVQGLRIDPIRWMPKELVEKMPKRFEFTKQSDVWSFGVVLWEMWSKGEIPFGYISDDEVKNLLVKDGKSPLSIFRPYKCPSHIVNVMEKIFNLDPKKRPTFHELNEEFVSFRAYNASKIKGKEQGFSAKSLANTETSAGERVELTIELGPSLIPTAKSRKEGGDQWAGHSRGHYHQIGNSARWPARGRGHFHSAPRIAFEPRNPNWYQRQGRSETVRFGNGIRRPRPPFTARANANRFGCPPLSAPSYRHSSQIETSVSTTSPAVSSGYLDAEIRKKELELQALKDRLQQQTVKSQDELGMKSTGRKLTRLRIDDT